MDLKDMPPTPQNDYFSDDWRNIRHQPTVLIVEDHEDTREMFRVLLEFRGWTVIEAGNGESAVDMAGTIKPDLILMDVVLPRIDGLTATRRIREKSSMRQVPIIAVTGNASPQFQLEIFAAGCNECLIKPIDFERLDSLLTLHLLKKRAATGSQPTYSLARRSHGFLIRQCANLS
jgi:two-component system, cell cycle response regulator DivK